MAETRVFPVRRQGCGAAVQQEGVATAQNRNFVSARTIGALTPRVTKSAFEKFGFATAQLVADWRSIVGDRLAATTAPDKLKWPRNPGEGAGATKQDRGARGGATLFVRVEPAVALDVQYKTALILERINAYFGYRAVAELRIVQGAVVAHSKVAQLNKKPAADLRTSAHALKNSAPIEGIRDDGLKAALERMQAGLLSRRT